MLVCAPCVCAIAYCQGRRCSALRTSVQSMHRTHPRAEARFGTLAFVVPMHRANASSNLLGCTYVVIVAGGHDPEHNQAQ